MAVWQRNCAIIGGMRAILLIGLPIGGVFAWGLPVAPYLEFPPRTLYVEHAPFSWTSLIILGVIVAAGCLLFLVRLARAAERGTPVLAVSLVGLARGRRHIRLVHSRVEPLSVV